MGIDRATILGQLASLEQQQRETENTLQAIEGARQLCRSWLAKLDREEAGQRQASSEANNDTVTPA